jgi:ankyrin repeat protein
VTQGGVPVDERNDLGETALHLACSNGLDDVAAVLLAHGADLAIQDWVRVRCCRTVLIEERFLSFNCSSKRAD